MRTEVKIGIGVGAALAAVAVGWVAVAALKKSHSPADEPAANNAPADLAKVDKTDNINVLDLIPANPTAKPTSAPASAPAAAPANDLLGGTPVVATPAPTTKPSLHLTPVHGESANNARLDINWGDNGPNSIGPVTKDNKATPADAANPAAAGARTYVVKSGDSLWKIAEEMYGNGSKVGLIKEANKLGSSNALRVGQKLTIPPLPSKTPAATPVASADGSAAPDANGGLVTATPAASGKTYTVAAGDAGLWAIAKKVYGDGSKWELIAKANPGIRPEALRVGQKLNIPDAPGASANASGSASRPAVESGSSVTVTTHHAAAKPVKSSAKAAPAESSNRPLFD